MNKIIKTISAVMSVLMLFGTSVNAETLLSRKESGNHTLIEFYGNDDTTITVPGGNAIEKAEPSDAPLGGKALKFQSSETGKWIIHKADFTGKDLDACPDNAYFGMWIKIETTAETCDFRWTFWENPNGSTWNSLNTDNYQSGMLFNKVNYINKWAFIKADIKDLCNNPNAQLKNVYESAITLMNPNQPTTVYIQGLGVYIPELTVDTDDSSATLKWEAVENAASYTVKRDGNDVGTTTALTLTDENLSEGIYLYTVEALDSEGSAIDGAERTVSAHVTDQNLKLAVSIYDNEAAFPVDNFNFTEDDTSVPLGGAYIGTTELVSKINALKAGCLHYNISEYWDEGYLGFYLRTQYQDDWVIELVNDDSRGYSRAKYTLPGSDLVLGAWQFVRIPLKNFDKGSFDPSCLEQIKLTQTNNGARKVQGFGIYKERVKLTAEVTESGINDNGNAYVKLAFNDKMNEDTIIPANFSVDGLTCTSAVLDSGKKNAVIEFNGLFEFPKTYTLTIDRSVANGDKQKLSTSSLTFTTAVMHNNIAVGSVSANKNAVSVGTINVNAAPKAIYAENGGTQDITMFAVLYEDGRIIATAYDSKTEIPLKTSQNFECSIDVTEVSDNSDYRMEVYFVNNMQEGLPLCEKKTINFN